MTDDIGLVIQWWGTLFLVGAAAFPLTRALFSPTKDSQKISDRKNIDSLYGWWDSGYLFSKAVGMATVTFLVYLLGTLHWFPFNNLSVAISLGVVFVVGVVLSGISNKKHSINLKSGLLFLFEELFFFAALLFWSWIKAHEPSIHGLEKFMDFGFTKSILNSSYFPPADMWYAGGTINYYYFGHIVMAVLTKFSGLDLRYAFNLMLATIFALTATMSFSIGYQISQTGLIRQIGKVGKIKSVIAGLLTAFLVTLAGNLETIYAFTKGYPGDQVKPFWQLLWPVWEMGGRGEIWGKIGEGFNRYWYANATRFIPFTIHEFPGYSFVVSDVHGHVLSLPFVLLAIGLLTVMLGSSLDREDTKILRYRDTQSKVKNFFLNISVSQYLNIFFYGFLVAVLLMTNALDGPVYLALFAAVLGMTNLQIYKSTNGKWMQTTKLIGVVVIIAALTSLPFLFHFKSFVSGIAINCPPSFLANQKFGPLLFEGVEKCQHSPLWMLLILWGFFIYCGGWLIIKNVKCQISQITPVERLLITFFLFSTALIIFPEFFYFKDIYPMHFRSNTMFKLGYQAFILFSIVSGYTIVNWLALSDKRPFGKTQGKRVISKKIFFIFLTPLLFLVSTYPVFSVRSYFDSLRSYKGLDGLEWVAREYPDDYAAIEWLNKNAIHNSEQGSPTSPRLRGATMTGIPVIVEADGDSYTDYARFSAFTGLSTIVGWPVHEWLWRGSYDVVAPRREEVGKIYESQDLALTKNILAKYQVRFIIVGALEREKYKNLAEWKFAKLGKIVFQSGETTIYEVQ